MMRLEWWAVPNSLDYPHGLEVTPFRIVPTDWGPEISLRFNQSIKKKLGLKLLPPNAIPPCHIIPQAA